MVPPQFEESAEKHIDKDESVYDFFGGISQSRNNKKTNSAKPSESIELGVRE